MFGSSGSPPKDSDSKLSTSGEKNDKGEGSPELTIPEDSKDGEGKSTSPVGRKSGEESPAEEKRNRRSGGLGKVLSNAKNSFTNSASSPTRTNSEKLFTTTPISKLGKGDPALVVPQGTQNNAAGESHPGPRSSFRVGVTEDKNKKCRRTMEDTHAYLYNFLSTPAPTAPAATTSPSTRKKSPSLELTSPTSNDAKAPVVETDNGYFAIFDGHAGTFAAEWCGKKLHLILEDVIKRNPNRPIPELLDETFTSVDQQLEKLPLKNSGCTAVIAVLRWEDRIPNPQSATGSTAIAPETAALAAKESTPEGQNEPNKVSQISADAHSAAEAKLREVSSRQRVLYTANVGDARIILCRNGKALRLSYDHKGSDDNEGKRIANAGGLILNNRVNGVLAVTRALGDAYMKDLVTGHPYTTETVIQPDIDEFLILACDGLWDVCSDQEAVDLVRSVQDPQQASKILVDHALGRFSTDNLSCMIVRFNSKLVQDTVEARSERVGVEGDPASTIEGGVSETEAIVTAAKLNAPVNSEEMSDLATISTQSIQEEVEEMDPGPELDPAGLKRAREKAKEGQQAEAMDTTPG